MMTPRPLLQPFLGLQLPATELFQDVHSWTTQSPWAYYLLLLVPLAAFGTFWWQRKRAGSLIFGNTLALREVRSDWVGSWGWAIPGALRIGVLVFLALAISRPQKPNRRVVTTRGVDVVIALDMSASMNAVDRSIGEISDIQSREGRNPKNRFDVARDLIVDFIGKRAESGDRVGLIIFGYGAYVKFPLTTDYRRAVKDIRRLRLDDGRRNRSHDHEQELEACMNDCTISGAQTHIGDALSRSFLRVRDSKATDRSIILITDGEDKGSEFGPKYIAEYIRDWSEEIDEETKRPRRPIPIYTFLIGGGEHTYTPRIGMFNNEITKSRSGLYQYEDARGRFPANSELLDEIAKITGGASFHSYDETAFRKHFEDLEKTVYKRSVTNFPDERFMHWAWLAFLLLCAEISLRLLWRKFP